MESRLRNQQKLRRRIEYGYVNGKILKNGNAVETKPKGIQCWYDTPTLVRLVNEAFERNDGVCYINNKWQLQIRGKHLRRLLKAMPNVKQVGRILIKTC